MKGPYLELHELQQLEALLPHAIRDTMQGWKSTRLRGGSASMAFYGNISSSLLKAFDELAAEIKAQPEQEPVGTVSVETKNDRRTYQFTATKRLPDGILDIYTAPPQRKPLTDEEIAETLGFGEHTTATTRAILTHAARAIEAKIKENT